MTAAMKNAFLVTFLAILLALVILGIARSQVACVDGNPVISVGSSEQCGTGWPTIAMGTPNSRALSLATAYQATDSTKVSIFTVTLSSTANFSLTGGTTNSATIVIGPTNAVASGTGYVVNSYSNSVTGTIALGLNLNSTMTNSYTVELPTGWWMAVRSSSGTVTVSSAFDQSVG